MTSGPCSLPRCQALRDQCPRVTCRESPAGCRHPPHRSCCSACCQNEGSSKPPAHNQQPPERGTRYEP